MPRSDRLIREWKLLQMLEASRFGKTLSELTSDLCTELGEDELSDRTVRRDLEALNLAGFSIENQREGERGIVYTIPPERRKAPKISATCTELIALYLGRELLAPLKGTQLESGADSIYHKLKACVPDKALHHFRRIADHIIVRPPGKPKDKTRSKVVSTLNTAIEKNRTVKLTHHPLTQAVPRAGNYDPYYLVMHDFNLYLVARSHHAAGKGDADPVRILKTDRISAAEVCEECFEPPDRKVFEAWKSSMGVFKPGPEREYRIKLGPMAARLAKENPWHASQKLQMFKDGSAILSVKLGNDVELTQKILALNAEAEVLEPADFRERVKSLISQMLGKYGGVGRA